MKNGTWQKNIQREGDSPMQRKKAARLLPSSLLLLIGICSTVLGCGGDDPAESSGSKGVTTTPASISNFTTQEVVVHKVADSVRAIGTVQACQEVEISSEISGRIKKILLTVGDHVKRGDLLVEIDDETRQIALTQKKALLKKAEATRKKAVKDAQKGGSLFKQGIISARPPCKMLLEKLSERPRFPNMPYAIRFAIPLPPISSNPENFSCRNFKNSSDIRILKSPNAIFM